MLRNEETLTHARISDLSGVIPAVNGKIELVYEGEQEGAGMVAQSLINKAIRNQFALSFPDPGKLKKKKERSPYQSVIDWFSQGNEVDLLLNETEADYRVALEQIPGLASLVEKYQSGLSEADRFTYMEFILFGLAEHSLIGKQVLVSGTQFKDLFGSMFRSDSDEDDE